MSRAQIGVVLGVIVSTTALGVAPDLADAQDGEIEEAGVLDDASVQREDGGEDFDRKIRALRGESRPLPWRSHLARGCFLAAPPLAPSTIFSPIPLVPLARRRRWVSAWV